MTWIRVCSSVHQHPKVTTAARRLGIRVPCMVGHLAMLWGWVSRVSADGELGAVSDEAIAEAAGWGDNQDPHRFVCVLVEEQFLCVNSSGETSVTNWMKHQGTSRAAQRQAKYRQRKKKDVRYVTRDSSVMSREKHDSVTGDGERTDVRTYVLEHDPSDHVSPEPDADAPAPARTRRRVKRTKPEDTSPELIRFPAVGGGEWALREPLAKELEAAYELTRETLMRFAKEARLWVVVNPANKKTHSGYPSFLHRWIKREVNRGPGQRQANAAGPRIDDRPPARPTPRAPEMTPQERASQARALAELEAERAKTDAARARAIREETAAMEAETARQIRHRLELALHVDPKKREHAERALAFMEGQKDE